jgi:hypothetical protein
LPPGPNAPTRCPAQRWPHPAAELPVDGPANGQSQFVAFDRLKNTRLWRLKVRIRVGLNNFKCLQNEYHTFLDDFLMH